MRGHAVEQVLLALLVGKADFARVRLIELRDAVEHCCFSRAVRADEPVDFVAIDGKREIVHRTQTAEADGEMIDR
ncbi:hypothetical protein SDC9_172564 [bioreactor metagenome]|uniref:Uncharacterized protein n=1 Tax=bioreactor metagenome TaxID=1076179 RepID=A0A645GE20_9ZZZZ